jgi:uncharacterized coiled-coil DUF342 family protein
MVKFIQRVKPTHFTNKTHFEFMTETGTVLSTVDAVKLKIASQVKSFFSLLADEDAAILQVKKYETTDKISSLDAERDNIIRGINNLLKAALRHFDPQVRQAAERLTIVFDAVGEIANLPYDEETVAIVNLIQELGKLSAESEATGIAPWLTELNRINEELRSTMGKRYSEEANRSHANLRKIRKDIDAVYRDIVYLLEAGASLDGETDEYKTIFAEINARVSRYAAILAQKQGRRGGTKN